MGACEQCGAEHPLEVLELTFRRPDAIVALPAEQRALEARESDDLCQTKEGRWFVRGVLPLPVHERDLPYRIGLWVEVDEANAIPSLPATLGLAAALRLTGPTTRPDVFVADPTHPLYGEQTAGIPFHRAFAYTTSVGDGGRIH